MSLPLFFNFSYFIKRAVLLVTVNLLFYFHSLSKSLSSSLTQLDHLIPFRFAQNVYITCCTSSLSREPSILPRIGQTKARLLRYQTPGGTLQFVNFPRAAVRATAESLRQGLLPSTRRFKRHSIYTSNV